MITHKNNSVIAELRNKGVLKQELEKIEQEFGMIRPKYVLDEARSVTSPLHQCFEWDDSLAGENYRLLQAGMLIVSVKVVMEDKVMNSFQSVSITVDDKTTTGYVSLAKVMENDDLKLQVLARAAKEMRYWERQYQNIDELAGVIDDEKLQKVEEMVQKGKDDRKTKRIS